MTACNEHDNEGFVFTKCAEFLDWLRNYKLFNKDPSVGSHLIVNKTLQFYKGAGQIQGFGTPGLPPRLPYYLHRLLRLYTYYSNNGLFSVS